MKEFTPEKIAYLERNEIFVFGSNLGGRHSKGAALTAYRKFGAKMGVGVGLVGQSYAIPTKDRNLNILPLYKIENYILRFLKFALNNPQMIFLVTKIGCGLAKYKVSQIGPLFTQFKIPPNVILPKEFIQQTTE